MKCSAVQDALMRYAEKNLQTEEALQLHQHVCECEACRELFLMFDVALDTENVLADGALLEAPADFTASVMGKIRKKAVVEVERTRWPQLLGALYAVALAAVFVVFFDPEFLSNFGSGEWLNFASLGQIGQSFLAADATAVITNALLGIFVVLASTLAFLHFKPGKKST